MEYRVASLRSRTIISRMTSLTSTNSRSGVLFVKSDDPMWKRHELCVKIVKAERARPHHQADPLALHEEHPATELVDVNEVIREMIVLLRSEATRYSYQSRRSWRQIFPRLWQIACNYSRS